MPSLTFFTDKFHQDVTNDIKAILMTYKYNFFYGIFVNHPFYTEKLSSSRLIALNNVYAVLVFPKHLIDLNYTGLENVSKARFRSMKTATIVSLPYKLADTDKLSICYL